MRRLGLAGLSTHPTHAGQYPGLNKNTNTELGNDTQPQLYNAKDDPGETRNLAAKHPEKVKELAALLERCVAEPVAGPNR